MRTQSTWPAGELPRSRTSGLAVTAAILCLIPVTFPLGAILAGATILRQRRRADLSGSGLAKLGLAAGLTLMFTLTAAMVGCGRSKKGGGGTAGSSEEYSPPTGLLGSVAENARRTQCAVNLHGFFKAISLYEKDEGSYPHVAATDGPDTQAGWWLMVCRRGGAIPAELTCPSDRGVKEFKGTPATDTPFPDVNDEGRIDATTSKNVNRTWSYSFQISNGGDGRGSPMMPSSNPARFAIVADRAPYSTDLRITTKTTLKEAKDELKAMSGADRIKFNSPNHGGEGQNVLYRAGHVKWENNPWCGIGDDCIYSVAAVPAPRDTEDQALAKRIQGKPPAKDLWPSSDDDSVLCNMIRGVPCVRPGR